MTRTRRRSGPSPSASCLQRDAGGDGDDQVPGCHGGADLGEQRRHRLRLDGQDQQVAVGDDLAVVGGDAGAGDGGEGFAGRGDRVAGDDALRRGQAGVEPAARQGRRHLAGAEEADAEAVSAIVPPSVGMSPLSYKTNDPGVNAGIRPRPAGIRKRPPRRPATSPPSHRRGVMHAEPPLPPPSRTTAADPGTRN